MNFFIKHYESLVNIARTSSSLIIFLSGIGRYRIVIIIILYNLLNLLAVKFDNKKYIDYLLLPTLLIAVLLDSINGPLYPVFKSNSVLLAFALVVVFDKLSKSMVEKYVSHISCGSLFTECPSCGYGDNKLTSICSNCNYTNNSDNLATYSHKADNKHNKLSSMLDISNDEILFKLKLFPLVSVFINGEKDVMTYLVITSNDLIFIDYFYFASSWRKKEVLPISSIISFRLIEKNTYVTSEPAIEICTDINNKYEIVFLKIFNNKVEINQIIKFIQKKKQTQ